MNLRLIIFTRFPVPGKTKTRLISSIGKDAAAVLQREMTEHTVRQARKTGVEIEIRYTGGTVEQMRHWLGADLIYTEQGEGDLGERMQRACEDAFSEGLSKAVIVGSDCPFNDGKNLNDAFRSLESHELVIGPANDGGYYLIGLDRAVAMTPLFKNIEWGGEYVFAQTMRAASGLSVYQLPKRNDVDRVEDIPPKISVIVPTLNEEAHLSPTLEKVREGFGVEIIVVDGGSSDGTRSIFPNTIECKSGRAAQQNFGAEKASGDILLFLHADTILPDAWDRLVRETLADASVAVGAFRFKVRETFPGQKFIEDTANWRSVKGGLPFGDQGLFLRKETFEAVGGFPDMPIMEDYAFVRSLRHVGAVVTRPEAAITSGRRWQQHGVLKVTLVNKLMILGYRLGISPERLARFYRGR
ncbi:DUF2064 domain-containing protein [Verrucomicrobia bacterium S94]|nr:DUF2064 domain-containing protein [Verrucomicrobia bacterium S94]